MLVLPANEVGKFKNILASQKGATRQKGQTLISENDLFVFLKNRVGKLDGIVLTGGEPTLHKDLPKILSKIKGLDFKIKLDTNGTNPTMLQKLISEKIVDYLAMDIKAAPEKYDEITGKKVKLSNLKKSIRIIRDSNLPCEFRSTIVPGLHTAEDIKKMGELIRGADKWYLQAIKSDMDLINPKLKNIKPYTKKEMEEFRKIGMKFVKECVVR